MPNTNPSDLDRAAHALESKLMEFCTNMEDEHELNRFDDIVTPALVQLRASFLPRASGVPEAEAVAAFRLGKWMSAALDDPNVCSEMKADIEAWFKAGEPGHPVYSSPPPVAAPSGEAALRRALQDLVLICERNIYPNPDVDPEQLLSVMKRAQVTLEASPIASEPKDAVSGEGLEMTWQEQIAALHLADATKLRQEHFEHVIDRLHILGYRITRTAPSGAKP